MHHDHAEALHLVRDLGSRLTAEDTARVDVSIHPPFTDLRTVQTVLEDETIPLLLGAQHCFHLDSGAYTGEVSPQMLARLGISYVLVGHSERRRLFGMDNEAVAATVRAVLRHKMTPICCVGESSEERHAGRTQTVLKAQLQAALEGLDPEQVAGMVVAYEPIWAIGSGRAATTVDAEDACVFVRGVIGELAGDLAAHAVRIQYGGSVNADNAAELVAEPDIDGLLLGGASLEAEPFLDTIRAVGRATAPLPPPFDPPTGKTVS